MALWRFLPEGSVEENEESRRCDSLSKRWRARSFLRSSCSVGLSASSSFFFVGNLDVVAGAFEDVGGFEDCCREC